MNGTKSEQKEWNKGDMKKHLMAAIMGIVVGIGIYKATKRKQKKAKEAGKHAPYGSYEACFKRPLDYIAALLALLFLWPFLGIVALFARIKLGSPVIFMQERPGKDGKIFRLYKFRTMTDKKDENGELLPDEMRLTEFGKKLRATSLDELPELFNILKGEMSLVGPRPLLVEYLPRYSKRQARRHEVRPGLTGLAQVKGRNTISWEEKFAWDVRYVEKVTFLGDMKILFETVGAVLKKEGINSDVSATMEKFEGQAIRT